MHILFLTNEYPSERFSGGGIGTFVQFLGKHLTENNIKVTVVGFNDVDRDKVEEDGSVTIYRLKKSIWKLGRFYDNNKHLLNKIEEINQQYRIDVVEGSELNFAFFSKKTTYKKVIRLHGGHHFFAIELNKKPAFWRGFQEKKSFKKADAYIAVSNYVGKQTQKHLKYNFDFVTIYNSIDFERFKPIETVQPKANSLLFVGTVCEKKGIRQLVQAMTLIQKEIPDITLKIVGRDWKSSKGESYIEYLKTFMSEDVKTAIKIIGSVPHIEVSKYIAESTICVYPSHMESFGLSVIEALMMGKPVVCSNIPPFMEIKGRQEILKMVNPMSIEEISKSIINLMKSNDLLSKMGELAKEDILKRFSPSQIVKKNIKYYKKLLK